MENELINKIRKLNRKIIVAGNGGVGRTTLLFRYTKNYFKTDTTITRGIQIFTKCINIDNENINFIFWDLAKQERWRFFQGDFCKGADGAILTFDLTRDFSLDKIGEWVKILRSWNQNLPIILLGTKYDLIDEINVGDEYCMVILEKYKLTDFLKVSCKTGDNVQKALQSLYSHVLKIPREKIPEKKVNEKNNEFFKIPIKKRI